jgi:hypothetical protein
MVLSSKSSTVKQKTDTKTVCSDIEFGWSSGRRPFTPRTILVSLISVSEEKTYQRRMVGDLSRY